MSSPPARPKFLHFVEVARAPVQAVSTLLVLDHSLSMDQKDFKPRRLDGAKMASAALLDIKLRKYPDDLVGIVAFAEGAKIVHDLAQIRSHHGSLNTALNKLGLGGGTNLTAGLTTALKMLSNDFHPAVSLWRLKRRIASWVFDDKQAPARPAAAGNLRQIIVLSDGGHNAPGDSPVAIAAAAHATCGIDVIGIGGSPTDVDEALLKQVASKNPDGSARYCFISSTDDLIQRFGDLGGGHLRPM